MVTEDSNSRHKDVSFTKLAEISPGAILKLDSNGRIVFANTRAKELLDIQETEIGEVSYKDRDWKITDLKGEKFPREKLPFHRVKSTKEPVYNIRHAVEWPEKKKKYLSVNASPLFEDGAFSGIVAVINDITGRRGAEEDLKASEARYRRLFETAQDGMLILNADSGKIVDANFFLQKLLGYSKTDLLGKKLWEIESFQGVVEDRNKFKKLVKQGYTRYEHLPLRTKDGKEASVEFVSNPYKVDGQKVVQCNVRDITERKKAERKLRDSERKYRSLFNSIRDAILVADSNGKIIDCNPAFSDLFGYELKELEGKKTKFLYHDKGKYEKIGERMGKSIESSNYFCTVDYEKKNGEVFPGETNIFYLKDEEGKVLGFIGLIRNVTERIERQKELERSEKRYRTVFENTGTAMMMIEEDTTISLANKKVEELTGYSKKEIRGMRWTNLVAQEDDLERMKKYHYLRREDPDSVPNQYEFDLVDKDGNERDVFIHIDLIPGTKNSVASLLDVTEEKNYEQNLRQSFIELAETTSRVLGVRDPYTREHEQRVAELSREVGKRMDLDEDTLMGLYLGGILHDIGKVAVPASILTKPGKLKDFEWEMIKSHPEVGYNQILDDTDFPWPVAEMTLHHHERLDGSGYPDGLEENQLSLEVRILGPVDVIEAMSTRRPYRPARTKDQTLKVIKEGRGTKFDEDVVKILINMIEEGRIRFGN